MSTFSNDGPDSSWNGPDINKDKYFPYIKLIKELERQITELATQFKNAEGIGLEHVADTYNAHNVESRLAILADKLQLYADSLQYTVPESADQVAIDAAITDASTTAIETANTYTDEEIAKLTEPAKQYVDDSVAVEKAEREDADTQLQVFIDEIKTMTDVVNHAIYTNDIYTFDQINLKIKAVLETLDIYCEELFVRRKIDFVEFKFVNAIIYPNVDNVLIIGRLSEEFIPEVYPTNRYVKPKAATAYIKWVDGKPWNAVVEMSGSVSSNNLAEYRGAITAVVSKAPDNGTERGPVTFGLYRATTDTGVHHIYLGVKVEEAIGSYKLGGHASDMNFYVAGINFVPGTDEIPAGDITEICKATAVQPGDVAVSHITADGGINTDTVKDSTDQNLISIDEDGNLIIGSNEDFKQVTIYSTDRPSVIHADLSSNKIAYLSDLSQSVYWQRSVTVIGDSLVSLNAQRVTTDGNGNVVKWNPTSINNVPGYYLTDPTSNEPAGHIFVSGDTALVKVSGTKERVVDGEFIGTIVSGTVYSVNQITGIMPEVMKTGTTVIDTTKQYYKIASVGNGQVTFIAASNADIFEYDCPAYATFDGGFIITETIPVPKTFDGYIHDISYEWSGVHELPVVREGDKPYYVESYVTWTAHHQNDVTVAYSGNAWDYVDLQFAGFRSAARQDEIDLSLEALAFTQSDFADSIATKTFALPEQETKTIPNPAYIQNRPWTGVAVIDGGTFEQPNVYAGWVVDGGDFTGMSGAMVPSESTPAVEGSQYFRNAIIRVWRGLYADMPEVKSPGIAGIWQNYAFTFRICTDAGANGGIWYSDGKTLVQLKSGNLVQEYVAPIAKSEFFHEHDGGGYRFTTESHIVFGGANDGVADGSGMLYEIYAVSNDSAKTGMRLKFTDSWAYLTSGGANTIQDKDRLLVKDNLGDLANAPSPLTPVAAFDGSYNNIYLPYYDVVNSKIAWRETNILPTVSGPDFALRSTQVALPGKRTFYWQAYRAFFLPKIADEQLPGGTYVPTFRVNSGGYPQNIDAEYQLYGGGSGSGLPPFPDTPAPDGYNYLLQAQIDIEPENYAEWVAIPKVGHTPFEIVVDISNQFGVLKILFDVDNNLLHFHCDYGPYTGNAWTDPFLWSNILPRDPGRMHIPDDGFAEGMIYAETQNFGRIPMIARMTFATDYNGTVNVYKTGTLANDIFVGCRLKGDFTVYLKST
jgi:hypothetical protein